MLLACLCLVTYLMKSHCSAQSVAFSWLTMTLGQALPESQIKGYKGSMAVLVLILLFAEIILTTCFLSDYFTLLTIPPLEETRFDSFSDLAEKEVRVYLKEESYYLRFSVFKPNSPSPDFAEIGRKTQTYQKITEEIKDEVLRCHSVLILTEDRLEVTVKV